jgi:hypothetical protein
MTPPFTPPPANIYFSRTLLFLLLAILLGCSKDDDLEEPENTFYKDALTSATASQLSGTWAIFEVGLDGQRAEVPVTYEDCGRDFFQFMNNGTYRDYLIITSYECEKQIQDLDWELSNGVITLQNSLGQEDEMVILQLNQDKLVFKMNIDIDEDGETEIITFGARRYTPPNDPDLYSYTFGADTIDNDGDKIRLTWMPYDGFYAFERYEIYRSTVGCSKTNAELITSIEDRSVNFFIDEDPPVKEEICYFFKLYNENGLVGESELTTFFTEYLRPAEVEFTKAEAVNNQVELKWQPFEGNYFSHYEITVRNYEGGTGYAYQEYSLKVIEDKEVSSFIDEDPPRLKNPVYAIYAYDIFGNISSSRHGEKNSRELNWTHPEVLNFDSVKFVAVDPEKPEVFFYGRQNSYNYTLLKYNYQNHQVTATANKNPEVSTNVNMRFYNSGNRRELFFPQGSALAVYDAGDLSFKYNLVPDNYRTFYDFVYLGDNIFGFIDNNSIYTYKRSNANLELIAKRDHFTAHLGNNSYHIVKLKNGELLVGHFQESQSFKFSISSTGEISSGQLVNIPIRSRSEKKTLYSEDRNYVVNLLENKVYSTQSYSLQETFESPYFPTGISRNGNLILGSNNDPQENISNESIHEKKARLYELATGKLSTVDIKGYPHLLFENHLGQIISISSGFKRENLDTNSPKPDIFVEVVQ